MSEVKFERGVALLRFMRDVMDQGFIKLSLEQVDEILADFAVMPPPLEKILDSEALARIGMAADNEMARQTSGGLAPDYVKVGRSIVCAMRRYVSATTGAAEVSVEVKP